jgi:hypothetical protein
MVCAVTLSRRRRTTTAAWSNEQARVMDEIRHAFGSGPCLHAMNSGTTVLVDGTREDACWPEYGQAMAILVKAASGRNQKLRTLGEQLVSSMSVQGPVTHFD